VGLIKEGRNTAGRRSIRTDATEKNGDAAGPPYSELAKGTLDPKSLGSEAEGHRSAPTVRGVDGDLVPGANFSSGVSNIRTIPNDATDFQDRGEPRVFGSEGF
jgi:hypothetical protein